MAKPILPARQDLRKLSSRLKQADADVRQAAAGAKQILLPEHLVTRAENNVSHLISESDLLRIRHAADGRMSPWLELSWGAVIGNLVPAISACHVLATGGIVKLEKSDLLSLTAMALFLGFAIALSVANWSRKTVTVGQVCDEISGRLGSSNPDKM